LEKTPDLALPDAVVETCGFTIKPAIRSGERGSSLSARQLDDV